MKIAVVGGGAAGIAATACLLDAGVETTLYDANPDLGGRCRSHLWNDRWLIRGAAAFVAGEDIVIEAARSLGIYDEDAIMESEEELEFTVLHPTKGVVSLGTFKAADIVTSPLLSLKEKAKMSATLPTLLGGLADLDAADPTGAVRYDDMNACEYFARYSPNFADYMLEPIMAQYFGYNADDFSLAWLLWVMGSRRGVTSAPWTYRDGGTGVLTASFEKYFHAHPNCTVRTDTDVSRIEHRAGAAIVDGKTYDAVVCAVPGSLVNNIVADLPTEHAAFFEEVEYVAHHIFHLIVDKPTEEVPFSLLYPIVDDYRIVSNTWVKPYDDTRVILYGEVKGAWAKVNRHLSDAEIIAAAMAEIARGMPAFSGTKIYDSHLQRNDIALCSRRKGYTTALQRFRALPPLPRIRFAGDYLINSTVGQSMRSGQQAARGLLAELGLQAA